MLIRESDLRMLIREEITEVHSHTSTDAEVTDKTGGIVDVADAVLQLRLYAKMKEEADVPELDKYFHFLAFCAAGKALKNAGVVDIAQTLGLVGDAKELADLMFSSGTGIFHPKAILKGSLLSRIFPVKLSVAMAEWEKDQSLNTAGISVGLEGGNCCDPAINHAKEGGSLTLGQLKSRSKDKSFWDKRYDWAFEEWPHLYGDDNVFIQPRYHCGLTPHERSSAYGRMNVPMRPGIKGPLRTA